MAEGGEVSDADSDETIVEGSVIESDLDEKELRAKRFSLMDKDMVLARESTISAGIVNIYGEKVSPEIQFNCVNFHTQGQPGLINLPYQEINENEESQSLLPIEINSTVSTTNICQLDCMSATTVDGEYKLCIGLDSKVAEVLELSDGNTLNQDDSPEKSLLSDMDVVKSFPNDVPKYLEMSVAFQSVGVTSSKNDMADNDGFHEAVASNEIINSIVTEMFGVKHVIKPVDEFETSQMSDMLECQDGAFSMDTCVNESNALPEELLAALNTLTESVAPVENSSGYSTAEKRLTLEQTNDNATEIIDTDLKSQSLLQCHEEPKALMMVKMSCTSDEHGNSCTLRKSAYQRKSFDVDATSDCQLFLEGTHQKMHRFNDKEYESSHLGICTCHCLSSDSNTKTEEVRKSQRIAKKTRKQLISNCSSESSCNYISLSVINRRDTFGQTLLHRAAIEDDIDGIRAMIKAGANVNVQDYAGWTPLHESSMAGCFEISNELLKAGADVNCKGHEQVTPLHDAVKEGHYKEIPYWLSESLHELFASAVSSGKFLKLALVSNLTLWM